MPQGLLDPALDPAELARSYRIRNRLQIRNLLRAEEAERVHQHLVRQTPWTLVYNENDDVVRLPPEALHRLAPQERAARIAGVYGRARGQFQFAYNAYLLMENYLAGSDPGSPLNAVYEWINSPEMLDFVRAVSGIPEIIKADAQATLYLPGHFLKTHNDDPAAHQHWRVAYVLSFAKDWDPDWGGLLQFFDNERAFAEREIAEVFIPRFNALSLFTVPQRHAVSLIAPFAPPGRLSITGWFSDA